MRLVFLLAIGLFATCHAGFFDSLVARFTGGGSNKISPPSSFSTSSANTRKPSITDEKARKYLQNFGYVPPANSLQSANGMAGDIQSAEQIFKSAIRKFQEFAGLAKTGILDTATKAKMVLARCGVTDAPLALTSGSSSQFKWPKNKLTYSIESFSSDLPKEDVRRAIAEAYSQWAKVTPLEFSEVPAGSTSDIKVRFGSGNHNDPWPFDGEGGVLAHATMPESGMFHFDDDENWTYKDAKKIASNEYTDLLAVAIHEGGHTLGLEHSRDEKAIMAPFYQKTTDANGNYVYPNLKSDDIQAIQSIYGAGSGRSSGGSDFGSSGSDFGGSSGSRTTTYRPTTTTRSWFGRFFGNTDDDDFRSATTTTRRTTLWPTTQSPFSGDTWGSGSSGSSSGGTGRCPSSIDAYTPSDSFSYAFSGSQVYTISGTKVTKVQPIQDLFPSAPRPVSGALFNTVSGSLLLFSSNKVYSYYYSRIRAIYQMDSGFPKSLPSDLGFSVSGALRWINGHQILLSSSDEFAVYDEFWNQVTLKNRISSYFPNLPKGVKGLESPAGSVVTAFTSNQTAHQQNIDSRTICVMFNKHLTTVCLSLLFLVSLFFVISRTSCGGDGRQFQNGMSFVQLPFQQETTQKPDIVGPTRDDFDDVPLVESLTPKSPSKEEVADQTDDEVIGGESAMSYFKKLATKTRDYMSGRMHSGEKIKILSAYAYKDHFSAVIATPKKIGNTVFCRYLGPDGQEVADPVESTVYPFFVVYCSRRSNTTWLGITNDKSEEVNEENSANLLRRKFKEYQHNVSFCLAPVYGKEPKWLHFVELVEHYKLQGITHFFIYIREIGDYDKKIIASYVASGEVEVIEVPGTVNDVIAQQLMGVADCLLRSRTFSKWSIFADIDERLIMTDDRMTIDGFFRNLSDESIGSVAFPQRWIMKREHIPEQFTNDAQIVEKMPTRAWHETTSAALKGHPVCHEQVSCWAKNVVHNEKAVRMLVHEVTDFYPGFQELFLDPSIGYIRHYRDVEMQSWEQNNVANLKKFGPFSNTSYPASIGSKLLKNVLDRVHRVYN
ncbi:unnamed protein product [Caenorhabditis sp. 36 PRJEB53466]|nr:unnamed protein product [Caenorhabditis sp. 36 PRJEB53466]